MQVTENEIMNLIQERGLLRFSTLMLKFHISSIQAIQIVEEYKKRGIIDEKCRATSGVKVSWKNPYAEDKMAENKENIAKKISGPEEKSSVKTVSRKKEETSIEKNTDPEPETPKTKKCISRKKITDQKTSMKPIEEPVQMSFLEESSNEKPKRRISAKRTGKTVEGKQKKNKKDMEGQMSLF